MNEWYGGWSVSRMCWARHRGHATVQGAQPAIRSVRHRVRRSVRLATFVHRWAEHAPDVAPVRFLADIEGQITAGGGLGFRVNVEYVPGTAAVPAHCDHRDAA